MASLFDLAVMTVSSAPGVTSNVALGSAAAISGITYVSFAAAGATNGTSVDYSILDNLNGGSEIGTATYSSTNGTLLINRTPTISTSSNTAINASSASIIRISARAETLQDGSLFKTGTVAAARLGSGSTDANRVLSGASTYLLGSRVLLNTLTAANSATLSDTTSFTATFPQYEIEFDNVLPGVNLTALELQVHSGGTFISSGGYITNTTGFSAGSATILSTAPTTYLPLTIAQVGNASPGVGVYGRVRVLNPTSSASAKIWEGLCSWSGTTYTGSAMVSGYYNAAAAIDGFQILFSSSNITSGSVKIYGLN